MAVRRLSSAAVEATPGRVCTLLPAHAVVLLAGLTAAVAGQGAFYGAAQRIVGLVLIVAAVLAWARPAPVVTMPPGIRRVLALAAVLALWALVSGTIAGDVLRAAGVVALLCAVATVVACCWRCTLSELDALARGVLALGVLASLAGWIGVAWHASPWALVDQDIWRAASGLTYSNANAGFLAPLTLLALARHAVHRTSLTAVMLCLLLAGLGATMSRGGVLALAAGLVALALAHGPRRLLTAAVGPAAGSLVALAGLLPSMPVTAPSRPVVALGALVGGIALAAGMARHHRRPVVAALAAAVVLAGSLALASGTVATGRLTLHSPDRAGEVRAALELAAHHPVVGVGPGWSRYAWTDDGGQLRVARFVHNEYLQVLAELGAVGFVILVALLAGLGGVVWSKRPAAGPEWIWSGATAGLIAVAVHAALDFGWHVPAVVLTGAVLVGMSTHPKREEHA